MAKNPGEPKGSYKTVADDLRARIRSGELAPGTMLPSGNQLKVQYRVDRNTVIRALATLEGEGLVIGRQGLGTFIRERPVRRRQARDRFVYRDARGYYFDRSVQDWVMLHPTEIGSRLADADVAGLLGIQPGTHVTARYRRLGPPGGEVGQISTSYLPSWIVGAIPRVAEADTGPGGIYQLLEEHGYRPLSWTETVWTRMPTPEESDTLRLELGTPVLLVGRITRAPDGRVVEVNVTTMPGDSFEVGYQVLRSPEAELPTQA